jgi:putative flippase GtrA
LPLLGVSKYVFEIANIIGIISPVMVWWVFSKLSKQFMVFLLTGGTAAAFNFGSRFAYNQYVDFSTAVIFAYITGMITAFVLAKLFVFKESQQSLHKSAVFFILVNLVAIAQTWGISMVFAHYLLPFLGVTIYVHEIAHATGVVIPVFTSYIGHKRWSFK